MIAGVDNDRVVMVACSVSTCSLLMILGWMVGDLYKSAYVYLTHAPLQFLMCGVFQVFTDAFILFQMFVLYNPDSKFMVKWRQLRAPTGSPVRDRVDVSA